MNCSVCGRETPALGAWFSAEGGKRVVRCSSFCLEMALRLGDGAAAVAARTERAAADAAVAAGAHMDGLGTTDLAKLTVDQWHDFVRATIDGYFHALRRETGGDET